MPTKKKVEKTPAEGKTAVSSAWNETPTKVTPENISGFQQNIHYQDAVSNIMRQVFPAPPEIWVTNEDGETDEQLTADAKQKFEELHGFDLMRYVTADGYGRGCAVFSPGIEKINGVWELTELRHLSADSFRARPMDTDTRSIIVNDLMPGIIVTPEGESQVWQYDSNTGTFTRITNYLIVKQPGTPSPSGCAYMRPVYPILSLIDFAAKAQTQQINRIGAPVLLLKALDDISTDEYASVEKWGKLYGKRWGKDTFGVIPPGLTTLDTKIRESSTAKEFVEQCVEWIRTYTNPMSDMTQTGNLGSSDTGRMEIWVNFISAEQSLAENWIEELFDKVLMANGYEGYHTHIQLKRPSIDRAAIKLQYVIAGVQAKSITKQEIRDNMTDTLELKEWSPEIELALKNEYPASSMESLFSNTKGFTRPEDKLMNETSESIDGVYARLENAILKVLKYNTEE